MSRIGNLPVPIPAGVVVTVDTGTVGVKGPKGALSQNLVDHVELSIEDDTVVVSRKGNSKQAKSSHGLMRSLIGNMVTGVTQGFRKELQVVGVGYRADVKGNQLVMQLGYSHPIEFDIPQGISIETTKDNKISVSGIDKQQVGQVAAIIRGYRKPDSYKGKGVRYVDEYIRIKAGKTA